MAELKVKGHVFYPGIEVTITGERGRFRFQHPSWNSAGKLILTFIGGTPGHECWRSFYAERVKKVYENAKAKSDSGTTTSTLGS